LRKLDNKKGINNTMKIIEKNKNFYKVIPEDFNDLWILSNILEEKDIVYGTTLFKVKIGSPDNYKIDRKKINVELQVVECNLERDILNIKGYVKNENEYISKNTLLTIKIRETEILSFKKENLNEIQKKLLKEAEKDKKIKNLLIGIDNNSYILIEFNNNNYKIIEEKTSLGNKKLYKTEEKDYIEIIYNNIKDYLEKNYNNIIIYGPGFWKNQLKEYIKKILNKETIVFHWNDISISSIIKVIEEITKKGILKENNIARENELINTLKTCLSKSNNLCFYGNFNRILEISYCGAIDFLLLTTNFLDKLKESKENYNEFKNAINAIENSKGKIFLINSKNEPGIILDKLGGISILLRYPL